MHCERFIKYNGIKIDLSGLGLDILKIGELGIETTLLQAASQSLMILDFSHFTLCNAVKNAPDEETRRKSYNLMLADISRSNAVCEAIASLSLDPKSVELQKALKEILASRIIRNQNRVVAIEKQTKSEEFKTTGINEKESIDVGSSSLEAKLAPIASSIPPPREAQPVSGFNETMYQKIEGFHTNLMYQRNQYEEEEGIITLYNSIKSELPTIYRDKKLMGNNNAILLRNIAIRLGNLVKEYKPLEGTGIKDEHDLRIKIIIAIEEIIEVVDGRFSQLANLMAQTLK